MHVTGTMQMDVRVRVAHVQVLRKQREEQAGGPHAQGDSSSPGPARAALGAVRGRLSRGVRTSQRAVAPAALGGTGSRQLASRPAAGGSNAKALDVFVDDEFGTSSPLLCFVTDDLKWGICDGHASKHAFTKRCSHF